MAWWEPTTGSFTCVAAYQAIGAADVAASYVNLANPGTNDLTASDAPTFDTADGWTFNGTSNYLISDVVPDGDRTSTILVRFSNHGGTAFQILAGQWTGTGADGRYGCSPNWGSNDLYIDNLGDVLPHPTPAITAGVIGFANTVGYKNGASVGNMQSLGGSITYPIFIGCWNKNGSPSERYAGKIQAVAIYSTTLDATQMAEISANMAELPVIVISGNANITQAGDTLSSSGALALAGAVSITEADSTLSATGAVPVLGMVSVAQADDALSASGALAIYGQFAVGQFGDTLVADGTLALAGEAVLTQSDDTLYATTVGVVNYGSAAIMQASNTLSAAMVLNRFRSRYRGTVRSIGNIRINEV